MPKPSSGKRSKISKEKFMDVLQSDIDKRRGTRGHEKYNSITWKTIQEDFARVGIKISAFDAKNYRRSINDYSANGIKMQELYRKKLNGEKLPKSMIGPKFLAEYDFIMKYSKVAPTFTGTDYIFRGEYASGEHLKVLQSLKVGSKYDFGKMVVSFSSNEEHVKAHYSSGHFLAKKSDAKSFVFRVPTSALKNSFSIKGMSKTSFQDEVLMGDHNLKVSKITEGKDGIGACTINCVRDKNTGG